jgi:hypothetical protein
MVNRSMLTFTMLALFALGLGVFSCTIRADIIPTKIQYVVPKRDPNLIEPKQSCPFLGFDPCARQYDQQFRNKNTPLCEIRYPNGKVETLPCPMRRD